MLESDLAEIHSRMFKWSACIVQKKNDIAFPSLADNAIDWLLLFVMHKYTKRCILVVDTWYDAVNEKYNLQSILSEARRNTKFCLSSL